MNKDFILGFGAGKAQGSSPVAPTLISKTITENGQYLASSDNADGYDEVTVSVANTYTADDEGKVVYNGTLVSQTSDTATQNGVVDTTLINSLTVNVPTGYVLIGSGSYTYIGAASAGIDFPVSYTGTPLYAFAVAESIIENTKQSYCFVWIGGAWPFMTYNGSTRIGQVNYAETDGTIVSFTNNSSVRIQSNRFYLSRYNNNYLIQPNTYNWYIYGEVTT